MTYDLQVLLGLIGVAINVASVMWAYWLGYQNGLEHGKH